MLLTTKIHITFVNLLILQTDNLSSATFIRILPALFSNEDGK